jgi:hypothetical protein
MFVPVWSEGTKRRRLRKWLYDVPLPETFAEWMRKMEAGCPARPPSAGLDDRRLPKQQPAKIRQIPAPNHPRLPAGRFNACVVDTLRIQPGSERSLSSREAGRKQEKDL